MLYLVTGANGAGKTLNTLKWVRERQIKEGRPVCHNGRFEPVENGELSTWKKIDIQKWQDEPDGTIFLVDECHNDFPCALLLALRINSRVFLHAHKLTTEGSF